jgi:hypothetical protein
MNQKSMGSTVRGAAANMLDSFICFFGAAASGVVADVAKALEFALFHSKPSLQMI